MRFIIPWNCLSLLETKKGLERQRWDDDGELDFRELGYEVVD